MAKLMRMSRKGTYRGYNKSVISPATPRLNELAGSWTWELPWRSSRTTRIVFSVVAKVSSSQATNLCPSMTVPL
jgi:hypothetical protein